MGRAPPRWMLRLGRFTVRAYPQRPVVDPGDGKGAGVVWVWVRV
ncbi:hypothetical protein [Streptomyces xanthophaeus]